jgi:hypothetical protein
MTESSENTASGHHRGEAGVFHRPAALRGAALDPLVQFHGRLEQQEQPAQQQDQVASRQVHAAEREQRLGQRDDPRNHGQQADPHQQCQRQAEQARAVALLRGQLFGKDGDEDQVVDAEDDLEHDQGREAYPDVRVEQPFHGACLLVNVASLRPMAHVSPLTRLLR